MKRIMLSVVLMFFLAQAYPQGKSNYEDFNIPTKENQVFYEFVDSIGCKGKSSQQIYVAARKTFTDLFGDFKKVVVFEDVTNSTILGKGHTEFRFKIGSLGISDKSFVKFLINFQSKNSKYRVQFYDFSFVQENGEPSRKVLGTYNSLNRMLTYAKKYRINYLTEFQPNQQALIKLFSDTIIKNLETTSSEF